MKYFKKLYNILYKRLFVKFVLFQKIMHIISKNDVKSLKNYKILQKVF